MDKIPYRASLVLTVCLGASTLAQQLPPKSRAASTSAESTPQGLTAGAWASIGAAYEAGRHEVREVGGAYQARNPGQGWTARFEDGGFVVEPDSGGWTWGLELQSYGFAGREQGVCTPSGAQAKGGRMSYRWDATLEEWYKNDTRGLEHGYTVHQRPARQAGDTASPLAFTLAVRGGLSPVVTGDKRGVRFVDLNGGAALTYTGLTVFDADGEDIPARFERSGDMLQLLVEEHGAKYPLTIDPIAQQAYLKASNTGANDVFGVCVAVSGDTVVVGAEEEDSNATGVNGDQSDNSASNSGAAYVFVRAGGVWTQQAYLKASNTGAADYFGWRVAIDGDTVVVGAPWEDSNATGVNGNQADNGADYAGAAYVFVRSGGVWSQQAYLKASNTGAGDDFAWDVGISGDTVVVGARSEASNATGVNGDQSNNSASRAGAAYVFVRSGTAWTQQAYLKASNTDMYDDFGYSVAISGDTVVVGATYERSTATGVNGDQSINTEYGTGAAYLFKRSGTTWGQTAYLKQSNTNGYDLFGVSVATDGDIVVVGAEGESSNAVGVNGDQSDNSAVDSGAVYIFTPASAYSRQVGTGCIATGAPPSLSSNAPVQGKDCMITLTSSLADTVGVLMLGRQHLGIPLSPQCVSYIDLTRSMVPVFFYTDVTGTWFSGPFAIGLSPVLTDVEVGLQAAVDNFPTGPLGLALSNGVWVRVGN